LGIQNHETNFLSYWIMKTITEKILYFSNKINECDYKILVLWLFEEINIVCNNTGNNAYKK
jgi:hypothetical protein